MRRSPDSDRLVVDSTRPGAPAVVRGRTPAAPATTRRSAFRRWWPFLRYVIGLLLAVAAVLAVAGHRSELQGVGTTLENLRWWWLPAAIVVEVASLAAFTGMEYRLLSAGGLRAPVRPLFGMTTAGQAIANSIPAGPAVSFIYGFRWFRRFGADDALAGWALVGTGVAAAVSLAILAAAGAAMAAGAGASLDLIPVIVGVLLVTVAVGALFVYERPLAIVVTAAVGASRRLIRRPRGDAAEEIARIIERVTVVRLGWREVIVVVAWGLANWVFDCACFAMAFLAVGAGIPWKGLLLAYGAGQLAANLPVTPGGLGAVEGSITIALVAFGGSQSATVDAVIVYRLISFWLVLLLGWGAWAVLAVGVRRGRWTRQAMEAPVRAELGTADDADPQPDGTASADPAHVGRGTGDATQASGARTQEAPGAEPRRIST